MNIWHYIKRPYWRTILLLFVILCVLGLAYLLWSPGMRIHDGRHDLRKNGIWIQHGWLGDDLWFARNRRDKSKFRDEKKIQDLADFLANYGVTYVFPHLCPSSPNGRIALVDPKQTERFLDHFEDSKVIPWIGGVLGLQCKPESSQWRANFVSSAIDLLQLHPRLEGVQINIEPMPTGNPNFLILPEDLRRAMPDRKILSVAAT